LNQHFLLRLRIPSKDATLFTEFLINKDLHSISLVFFKNLIVGERSEHTLVSVLLQLQIDRKGKSSHHFYSLIIGRILAMPTLSSIQPTQAIYPAVTYFMHRVSNLTSNILEFN